MNKYIKQNKKHFINLKFTSQIEHYNYTVCLNKETGTDFK